MVICCQNTISMYRSHVIAQMQDSLRDGAFGKEQSFIYFTLTTTNLIYNISIVYSFTVIF